MYTFIITSTKNNSSKSDFGAALKMLKMKPSCFTQPRLSYRLVKESSDSELVGNGRFSKKWYPKQTSFGYRIFINCSNLRKVIHTKLDFH